MELIVIQRAFIIATIVIAIWCCYLPGMILGKINDIEMPEWLASPVYHCSVCMTPYYGSAVYWVFFHQSVMDWILVIGVAMGICTIFVKIKKN